MKEEYRQVFDQVHASERLREEVAQMTKLERRNPKKRFPKGILIAAAILALMENQKLVAEGAGATPVAAALFGKLPLAGKKTVCLISGGNIDVNILSRVITRGLVMSGRKTNLMIALEDKPGQLSLVSDIVSACGANVVSVHHDRSDANMAITSCFLKLGLETRDAAQIETIREKLTEAGFKLVTERA